MFGHDLKHRKRWKQPDTMQAERKYMETSLKSMSAFPLVTNIITLLSNGGWDRSHIHHFLIRKNTVAQTDSDVYAGE